MRNVSTRPETRRCRCKNMCANVTARPDGRLWYAYVGRDEKGEILGDKVWANETGSYDGETYLPGINKPGRVTFTPDEWDALEHE